MLAYALAYLKLRLFGCYSRNSSAKLCEELCIVIHSPLRARQILLSVQYGGGSSTSSSNTYEVHDKCILLILRVCIVITPVIPIFCRLQVVGYIRSCIRSITKSQVLQADRNSSSEYHRPAYSTVLYSLQLVWP